MTAQSHTEDYSGDAYRACLAGRADANQQQSAASQIILLHAEKGRLLEALNVIANASERSETMFGGKMSDVTRVFKNITRVSRAAIAKATGEAGQ